MGDINRSGTADSRDQANANDSKPALPRGEISKTDNIVGYAGYLFNAEIHGAGMYTVRHRHYAPDLGRWLTRDPAGYVDGMNLYEYVRADPIHTSDPSGLQCVAYDLNLPQSPAGFSFYGRAEVCRSDDCISASLFAAIEWQPPGLRYLQKPLGWFNLHIEIGGRGGLKGGASFCFDDCGKSCLDEVLVCGRVEAFARLEYRRSGVKEAGRRKRFTRSRFGLGAEGGFEVCWNLCNGEVTADGTFSYYGYAQFGWRWFSRSYSFGDTLSYGGTIGSLPALMSEACCK